MELVYLLIGFGVGVLVGALLQDRVRRDETPKAPGELAELLKAAVSSVNKDEAVGITITAFREDDDKGGGDEPSGSPCLGDEMLDNWRNN